MGNVSKLAVIVSDLHIPFLDEKAYKIVLSAVKEYSPTQIIYAGDFQDFYSVSRFDSSPTRASDLEYEITCGRELLDKTRDIFSGEILFIAGNHEERLEKFLMRGANKALYNLTSLKLSELLNFKKYSVKEINQYHHLNDNFIVKHGTRCGQFPAQAEALSMGISGISGHAHKTQSFKKNYYKHSIEWYSIGCLCNISDMGYARDFSYSWDQSFAVVEYSKNNFKVDLHGVHNGKKIKTF